MSKTIKIIILIAQVLFAFILMFFSFMVFAFEHYEGGFDAFIGFILLQPVWGILASGLTLILCLGIGLPIRLNKKLNLWWSNRIFIPIALLLVGLTMLAISLLPSFHENVTVRMEGMESMHNVPNRFLSITGWFLTAFSSLHLFPPASIIEKLSNRFHLSFGVKSKNGL